MKALYRNPEIKRITYKFTILHIILCIIMWSFVKIQIKNFSQSLIRQNTGAVGIILNNHPELENEIISYFTKGISENYVLQGENILESYGYSTNMKISLIPIIKDFYFKFQINVALLMIIFFIPILCLIIFEYKHVFKKIIKISTAAEKIVDGDLSIRLDEDNEGDFSILGHQFNEMSNRLKKSLEQLKKDKIFLKDTISDISHQLKTPLASLIVFNELFLNNSIKDEETKQKFHEKSKNQLHRMEWLIKNLLKLAKIEAKAVDFDISNNLLITTIKESLEPLKNKWEKKNQTINIIQNQDNIYLKHDINWTSEAITNIIKNCIEHTFEGGNITLELTETPLLVSILITDNGEGIPKEDLPNIFKRFYKGKSSKKSDSIGIGLALAKSIIENQSGNISVRSIQEEGSVFDITFLKGTI